LNLVCDEGVERPIVERLRADGHHVLYIAESAPESSDEAVLKQAVSLASQHVAIGPGPQCCAKDMAASSASPGAVWLACGASSAALG
jgi:hypothetical protein